MFGLCLKTKITQCDSMIYFAVLKPSHFFLRQVKSQVIFAQVKSQVKFLQVHKAHSHYKVTDLNTIKNLISWQI